MHFVHPGTAATLVEAMQPAFAQTWAVDATNKKRIFGSGSLQHSTLPTDTSPRALPMDTSPRALRHEPRVYASRAEILQQNLDLARSFALRVPSDLLRRIEALQERNNALRIQQDELLRRALKKAQAGGGQSCGSSGGPLPPPPIPPAAASTRSKGLDRRADETRFESGVVGRIPMSCGGGRGSIGHQTPRNRPRHSAVAQPAQVQHFGQSNQQQRSIPLAQQLKHVHELLSEQGLRQAEDSVERKLTQKVLEPLGEVQKSLAVLAESHRRMQEEQQFLHQEQLWHVSQLETESARQQRCYQEHVLELEEAMLAQSLHREGRLAAELQELEHEWLDLQQADACLREQAQQLRGLALRSGSEGSSSSTSARPQVQDRVRPQVPSPSRRTAAIVAEERGIYQHQHQQLPRGMPHVYEAAVALIVKHGWNALHGGEHAGPAWTALHWAASEGRLDVCEMLLQARADPCLEDETGKTAIDYALENGQHGVEAMLHAAMFAPASPPFLQSWPMIDARTAAADGEQSV